MKREEELALKVTKEIAVKFIEVGKLSVQSFEKGWNQIYRTVRGSLGKSEQEDQEREGRS